MVIITHPNPILRKKARTIEIFDDELELFAKQFTRAMLEHDGVGLAGPQVGRSERIIAINIDKKDLKGLKFPMPMVLINPDIIEMSFDKVEANEACLSVPGKIAPVSRSEQVVVNAQDLDGKNIHLDVNGWFARVLQHEIDHLNGILFIDRVTEKDKISDYEAEKK